MNQALPFVGMARLDLFPAVEKYGCPEDLIAMLNQYQEKWEAGFGDEVRYGFLNFLESLVNLLMIVKQDVVPKIAASY